MRALETLLMLGVRKPRPNAKDRQKTAMRARIRDGLRACRARRDSVAALLEQGAGRDAYALLLRLHAGLADTAALLENNALPPDTSERLDALYAGVSEAAAADLARAGDMLDQASRLLALLEKARLKRLKTDLAVPMDAYARRLNRRLHGVLALCVLLCAGLILSWDHLAEKRMQEAAAFLELQRQEAARDVLEEIASLAARAKAAKKAPLTEITGRECTRCGFEGRDIRHTPESDTIFKKWRDSLHSMRLAAGEPDVDAPPPSRLVRDPWGSPYLLNENEKEQPGQCDKDTISSAGPDGFMGTDDDIAVFIDNYFCKN